MPRVPAYESQVESRPLPGFRQESVATPALLGGAFDSIANASKGLSDAGAGLSAVAYNMQERENADRVFQAETKWKAEYLDYQADIGKNRKGEFSKGVTGDTKKWWDESAKKHLEGVDNEVQRSVLMKRMTAVRLTSINSMSDFEAKETERSLDLSAAASKVGSIDLAAASADEATVQVSVADIKKTNAFIAARKGINDPVVLAKMNDEDITKLHQQVIQTLSVKNPLAAKAYFEAHKEEIRGSLRAEIGEFAQKATAESLGVAAAGQIWAANGPASDKAAANLDKMEELAREQFKNDPFVLKATIANLRERQQAFTTGRRERQDVLESTVNEAALKGASIAQVRRMPEFFAMASDKARAIEAFMENREYTKAARADVSENKRQRELRHAGLDEALTLSDPDELVKLTRAQVVNLLPKLGDELTTQLVHRHDALTKSAEALAAARIDNNTFKALAIGAGLDPNEKGLSEDKKDRLVQLRAAVDARLSQEARAAGKPLSPEDKVKFAKQAFDDVVRVPGFWSINSYGTGTALPASALTKPERDKAFVALPGGRVRLKDIPPTFVDEAEASLLRAKRPVTQKAVAAMWLLNKDKWGKTVGKGAY